MDMVGWNGKRFPHRKAIKMTKGTPAIPDPDLPEVPRYNPVDYDGESGWEKLVSEADNVLGYDQAKDELFDALEGVPFIITRLTFRPGIVRPDGSQGYFAWAETVIAPKTMLERKRIDVGRLPFDPGDHVGWVDGSTGIYRQLVAYLEAKHYVTLPEGPADGKMGESRFDVPIPEWPDIHVGAIQYTTSGDAVYQADIRLFCKRGIRRSEYDNNYTNTGSVTRYIG